MITKYGEKKKIDKVSKNEKELNEKLEKIGTRFKKLDKQSTCCDFDSIANCTKCNKSIE